MIIKKLISWIHTAENAFLSLLLSALIILSFLQIISRMFMSSGLNFIDTVNYQLVLWIGLIGAAIATRNNEHINIDVLSRILPRKWKYFVDALTQLFSTGVCALVTWASYRFIRDEMQFGFDVMAGIPSWAFASIIPLTFGVITIRFLVLMTGSIRQFLLFNGEGETQQ